MPRASIRSSKAGKIAFCHKRKAFVLQGKLVSGLLPTLRASLYPTYDWAKARSMNPNATSSSPTTTRSPSTTKKTTILAQQQCHGRTNGVKLDLQLHQSIRIARQFKLSPDTFINSQKRRKAMSMQTNRDITRVERLISSLELPALNFWRMCALKHYTPQYSQVTVGCIPARIGTNVDVKCIDDASKSVILIENKVGYASYYHSYTDQLAAPFTNKTNSAYNQHQLQIALTTEMHKQTFPRQKIARSCVWRYEADGVSEFPLEEWAAAGASTVLQSLTK